MLPGAIPDARMNALILAAHARARLLLGQPHQVVAEKQRLRRMSFGVGSNPWPGPPPRRTALAVSKRNPRRSRLRPAGIQLLLQGEDVYAMVGRNEMK